MNRIFVPVVIIVSLVGCTRAPEPPQEASPEVLASGLQVYTANCASCHQVDGTGVSNMQPALVNNAVVAGDPELLIRIVLKGPAAVLPAERPRYSNSMPAFGRLTDEQIADLLSYIRHDFGQRATPVETNQVQTVRSSLSP